MGAIHTDLSFVRKNFPPGVFRSVWDRLCDQLFGFMPIGLFADGNLPDIDIWKGGVSLDVDAEPYQFTVVTDDGDTPKAGDVILYKGKYYVIGNVE